MNIGVPREIWSEENRVGLTPPGAGALVEAGNEVYVETRAGAGCGFTDRDYEAVGAGGQFIFVRRASDLVVVMTSDTQAANYETLRALLNDYVLYAVRSDEPLPANPAALDALQALITSAGG